MRARLSSRYHLLAGTLNTAIRWGNLTVLFLSLCSPLQLVPSRAPTSVHTMVVLIFTAECAMSIFRRFFGYSDGELACRIKFGEMIHRPKTTFESISLPAPTPVKGAPTDGDTHGHCVEVYRNCDHWAQENWRFFTTTVSMFMKASPFHLCCPCHTRKSLLHSKRHCHRASRSPHFLCIPCS